MYFFYIYINYILNLNKLRGKIKMINNKEEFIKSFLPDSILNINNAQIDLDISDLTIADILRNINKTFPKNSRNRNSIVNGELAVIVLCKSELLYPISGILIIITKEDEDINLISNNYIVISIPETHINNDEEIKEVIENISNHMIRNYSDLIKNFNDFFIKYIYDEFEEEEDED
jgi:hypothetical protein